MSLMDDIKDLSGTWTVMLRYWPDNTSLYREQRIIITRMRDDLDKVIKRNEEVNNEE